MAQLTSKYGFRNETGCPTGIDQTKGQTPTNSGCEGNVKFVRIDASDGHGSQGNNTKRSRGRREHGAAHARLLSER